MPSNETKRTHHLRVPVFSTEADEIRRLARTAKKPVAAYLRQVGMGYQPKPLVDQARIAELARAAGELGRLGGLLELWLQDDARTRQFGEATIRAVLARTLETQDAMHRLMRTVVVAGTRRR